MGGSFFPYLLGRFGCFPHGYCMVQVLELKHNYLVNMQKLLSVQRSTFAAVDNEFMKKHINCAK